MCKKHPERDEYYLTGFDGTLAGLDKATEWLDRLYKERRRRMSGINKRPYFYGQEQLVASEWFDRTPKWVMAQMLWDMGVLMTGIRNEESTNEGVVLSEIKRLHRGVVDTEYPGESKLGIEAMDRAAIHDPYDEKDWPYTMVGDSEENKDRWNSSAAADHGEYVLKRKRGR